MPLLFSMLSRFVIDFLPRSKCLLILWLQSPSAVVSEPMKTNSITVSIVFLSICYEVIEPDMGQQTGLKLGKEYVKVVYCLPAYLTYM